jgi:F0F1-type ATP synthase delta subunit
MTARYQYETLLDNLYTKKQASIFLSQLDNLLSDNFNAQVDLYKRIEEILSYDLAQVFRAATEANHIDLSDPSKFKAFIVGLKDAIEDLPIMTMYLAFDPSETSLKVISSWFVTSLKKRHLLDIVVRREIVGGAVLVINGVYRDYSVKQKIHLLYKNKELLPGGSL